jgi:ankyrin repeat protein
MGTDAEASFAGGIVSDSGKRIDTIDRRKTEMLLREKVVVFLVTLVGFVGAGVANADGPREHALLGAIRRGEIALLESQLREGAPANAHTADGTTPLMVAALHGSPEMVKLLLDHGADPRAVDKRGASALLFAVGDARKVGLLLAQGADVNARTSTGNTPLIAAAAYTDNLEVIKLLLDKGADLQSVNSNNVSALGAAVYASDAKSVKFFLDQGCKPKQIHSLFGAAENSLLMIAAQMADAQIVGMLLEQGAEVNASDSNFAGHALNHALLSQKPDVARRLIEAGADLKLCSPIGKTPPIVLAIYSESGDASIARLMMKHGADLSAANQAGESALTWARRRAFPELVELLTSAGTPDPADPRPNSPNREVPSDADARALLIRGAVTRSVALMQRSSDVFLENRRTCVSCHHQNLQAVALGWARDRGFAVDEASVARMTERQVDTWSRRVDAAYEMDRPMPVPPQLLGYGLLGLSALGHTGDAVTDAYVWYLAAIQKPDGHWIPGGITRPPMGGSEIMSTVLAMRALQLYAPGSNRELLRSRVDKTKLWLANCRPVAHQDLAYKIMGLAWAGAPAEELQDDVTQLLALQQSDGGWAQLPQMNSDAWATGQSLVAMYLAGRLPPTDAALRRGLDFLLRTQFDDGSWYVQSRAWPFQPPFDSGFPFGRDQWISDGATAWATMALLLHVAPGASSLVPSRNEPIPDRLAAGSKTGVAAKPTPPRGAQRRAEPVDFAREIKPVLERSCVECHSGETPEGGFVVTERGALLRGGESGDAAVSPGRSGASPLFARVSSDDPDLAMPPLKKRDKFPALSEDELTAFRAWIDGGAAWPDGVPVQARSE